MYELLWLQLIQVKATESRDGKDLNTYEFIRAYTYKQNLIRPFLFDLNKSTEAPRTGCLSVGRYSQRKSTNLNLVGSAT